MRNLLSCMDEGHPFCCCELVVVLWVTKGPLIHPHKYSFIPSAVFVHLILITCVLLWFGCNHPLVVTLQSSTLAKTSSVS